MLGSGSAWDLSESGSQSESSSDTPVPSPKRRPRGRPRKRPLEFCAIEVAKPSAAEHVCLQRLIRPLGGSIATLVANLVARDLAHMDVDEDLRQAVEKSLAMTRRSTRCALRLRWPRFSTSRDAR